MGFQFDKSDLIADKVAISNAFELLRAGASDKAAAISVLAKASAVIHRRVAEIEGRKPEPIGIGPGGYDPTKDTDITGV